MTVYLIKDGQKEAYSPHEAKTVLELLWEAGYEKFHAPCGGNGTCKKCRITVEERGAGKKEVLACQTALTDEMQIYIEEEQSMAVADFGSCNIYEADGADAVCVACDIGTTTVVCHLVDGKTGKRLYSVSAPNAQRSFGADVISRIMASVEGKLFKRIIAYL